MVGFGGVAGWVAVAPLRWGALAVFVFSPAGRSADAIS